MKKLLLFMLTLVSTVGVYANDSEYFAIGNQLVPLRQSNIAVVKEVLRIRPDEEGFANVDVDYTFDNLSAKPQTILMGFETPTPYMLDGTEMFPKFNDYIKDFTVILNGRTVPFKVAVVEPNNEVGKDGKIKPIDWNQRASNPDGYGGSIIRKDKAQDEQWEDKDFSYGVYAYYFDAKFNPGINTLHHSYRYRMAVGVDFEYKLDYELTPATRWANGQIDDFTLEICCEGMVRDFIILGDVFDNCESWIDGAGKRRQSEYFETKAEEFVLRDAKLVLHAKDFKPTGELCLISRCSTFTSGFDLYEEKYDLDPEVLVYDTSNRFFWALLEYDQPTIQKLPWDTKRIIRSLPYAARGHVFQNKKLADFFNKCFWYIPAPEGPDYEAVPLTEQEIQVTKGYN